MVRSTLRAMTIIDARPLNLILVDPLLRAQTHVEEKEMR